MISFQWITLSFLLVSSALFAYLIPPEPPHLRISTTQIYAEVTNKMVSSDFRAISGNLAAMQRSVLEKRDRKQGRKQVHRSLRETA